MALPFSYSVCEKFVDQFVTVTDDQICAGLSLLQEEAKLAVEPAAGAVVAAAVAAPAAGATPAATASAAAVGGGGVGGGGDGN